MRTLTRLVGGLLLIAFCSMPISCQYTMTHGPEWLAKPVASRIVSTSNDGRPLYRDVDIITGTAVKATTCLLMVVFLIASITCFVVSLEPEK